MSGVLLGVGLLTCFLAVNLVQRQLRRLGADLAALRARLDSTREALVTVRLDLACLATAVRALGAAQHTPDRVDVDAILDGEVDDAE